MDFLNKALAQVQDLFRTMTPGARITTGLLLVAVVTSLGYIFRAQVTGPDVFLMNGEPIPPSHLKSMEAAFGKANLSSYQIDGSKIRVPRGQQAAYMAALAESKALPPNFGTAIREALNAGNPFESKQQRDQRTKVALQEELALIISSMKGIEGGYVLYDIETKGGLVSEKAATATVGVKPTGPEQLDDTRVSAIRHLVAGAIMGLKPENVTVADLNGGHVYHGSPESNGIATENLYMTVKRMHEQDLRKKILNALSYIPNLTVEPSIILDRDKFTVTRSIENKPKPVLARSMEKTKSRSREGGGGTGGRPGAQAQVNTPTSLASASSAKGSREEEEDSTREEENAISREHVEKESVGLTPDLARVSVGIPSSYFAKVWHERNPPQEGEEVKPATQAVLDQIRTEETTKIQKHVANLLPPAKGVTDATELVTITTFQDIKPGDLPAPAAYQRAAGWLGDHWSTLGLVGLAVFSLAMLKSMVRSVPTPPEPELTALRIAATGTDSEQAESGETKAAKRLHRFTGSGPSLRDELADLINEDPDAAANILRSWIGQVG